MLLQYIRDGLVEEEHILEFSDGAIQTNAKIYYLRSCAKPLQASLLVDFNIYKEFHLALPEIALTCASHAGEDCHINLAKSLMDKFEVTLSDLKCGIHPPLSKTSAKLLEQENKKSNELYNNCVGKHLLFLAICKINGWDTKTYDEQDHPLQKLVKKQINTLCEVRENYPITKDGCGVPILSMPLANMVKGYKNLFSNPKYEIIKSAFLQNPYIIGGEERLDTEIMKAAPNLIAKVGAGGLCIVFNTLNNEAIGIKIQDCDMKSRRIALLEYLNRLNWGIFNYENKIKTLHGDIVGEIILKSTPTSGPYFIDIIADKDILC